MNPLAAWRSRPPDRFDLASHANLVAVHDTICGEGRESMRVNKKEEMLEAMKKVRAQLTRRYIDTSNLNVTISGGNVHLSGAIRKLRAHPHVDLHHEMDQITMLLKLIPGVREVVWDVALRA